MDHVSCTRPGVASALASWMVYAASWKAKRVPDLEQLLTELLAAASGQETWEVFLQLDDLLGQVADGADPRLDLQNSYPVTG